VAQAEHWNLTTDADFIHVCDPGQAMYKALGLSRSLSGVWGANSLYISC
jgi:hypothetical protein